MSHQVPLFEQDIADQPANAASTRYAATDIAPDLAYKRLLFVNVVFVGAPGAKEWVLVDAGIPGSTGRLRHTAQERYGDTPPRAIILTHAHFDHVGAILQLAKMWDVPIYAHPLEVPYLNGSAAYPRADPLVGGGIMSLLSPLYPRGPIDISSRLKELPSDGTVPYLPGWRSLHTPGHSVGHISLWRQQDRALIAGDAVITTDGESAYATITQDPELHGPPQYFTHNWLAAKASVGKLAALSPELIITGHGRAMRGPHMRSALHRLADDFDTIAKPIHGKFTDHPCRAADGSAYIRKQI